MHLTCCGINHNTSSLIERESFQIQRGDLAQAIKDFSKISGAKESAIISTCNRIEFFRCDPVKTDPRQAVVDFYKSRCIPDLDSKPELLFVRQGSSVARHLFTVTAGLDSPVIGERQVLGQVKEAYSTACSVGTPGTVLHKLFHNSFHIAKKIRSETDIGSGVQGYAGAAVELVHKHYSGDLKGLKAVIIGVNHSSEHLISRLTREGVKVTVANRTHYNAAKLARPFSAEAVSLDDIKNCLTASDILFSSTSAPGFVINKEDISNRKTPHPLIAIDLAVPRDIDPQLALLPFVTLLDLEDIKRYLNEIQQEMRSELPYALDMIEEQIRAFEFWLRSSNGHGNGELREILEGDRKAVLERFKDNFKQGDYKALDAFSRNLYRQFLRRSNSVLSPDQDSSKN